MAPFSAPSNSPVEDCDGTYLAPNLSGSELVSVALDRSARVRKQFLERG